MGQSSTVTVHIKCANPNSQWTPTGWKKRQKLRLKTKFVGSYTHALWQAIHSVTHS